MPKETQFARELKKAVGQPKVIFVLGGPASGKGTQCAKLVEEFGYQHISTGDLMREEMDRNTKEGQQIKQIMADGGLVPNQLTIQLLVNALMSKPSKNYLLDGFPRTVEQAVYFEQNVLEAQQVLYFDASKELMLERCLKRAEDSTEKRIDDQADILEKRVTNFLESTIPVVNFYEKFGKVSRIDASGGVNEVAALTKSAVLPQIMFLLGQKVSGKSAVAQSMSSRANMKHLDFNQWKCDNCGEEEDDETVCLQLIQALSAEQKPRVVLEDFPQNEFQAKFFLRNCTQPSNVFFLSCSIDVSQARMNQLSDSDPRYISSVELSKQIKEFGEKTASLIPFLQGKTNFAEINTEGTFEKTMELVNARFEPCVIHVRPGAKSELLRKEITNRLTSEHGFVNLDIVDLQKEEITRKTPLGLEMHALDATGRAISANVIVRMLQQIVYNGQAGCNKFILTNFPDSIEQVREFESNCAKIQTVIYSTADEPVVELPPGSLISHNIDSQFQKEFRLQTMNCWDFAVFQEKLGNKVEYGVLLGQSFAGKSTLAAKMKADMDYCIIDMKAITEVVRESMKSEEGEPYEGDIPIESVEKEVASMINKSQAGDKKKFLFDGFTHKTADDFVKFLDQFGMPSFVLKLNTGEKYLKERYCKKNEIEEFPEDQLEAFKEQQDVDVKAKEVFDGAYLAYPTRCTMLELDTGSSLETTSKQLLTLFSPQVILINHEKRLAIDTVCSNLAIKYNMIYISAYQVIAEHVQKKTKWGQLLTAGKRNKELCFKADDKDEFNEAEYSPSLYDQKLVLDLMRTTIQEKRTNQKYVLLEGFCNSGKMAAEEDKLEIRFMDEFFQIEKHLGEVKAVLGLQFVAEPDATNKKDVQYLQFSEAEKTQEVKPPAGDGEGGEEPPEGEVKAPAFNPADYQWTVTNKRPQNLPQLFIRCKGPANTKHEVKTAEQYSSQSEFEAISKSLDELCGRAQSEPSYLYAQVVFQE